MPVFIVTSAVTKNSPFHAYHLFTETDIIYNMTPVKESFSRVILQSEISYS